MASSTGHGNLPHTSSPRMRRRGVERALILQGLEKGTKRPTAGSALPICGGPGSQNMWGLEPWAPVGDGTGGPSVPPGPPPGLWVKQEQCHFSRHSRPNPQHKVHADAISLSLRLLGVGFPDLGNTSLGLLSLPDHIREQEEAPGAGCRGPGVEALPLYLPQPPSSRTLPFPHLAGTGPGGSAWGMVPEATVRGTGRQMSEYVGVGLQT